VKNKAGLTPLDLSLGKSGRGGPTDPKPATEALLRELMSKSNPTASK
jgi:hypothetical protein